MSQDQTCFHFTFGVLLVFVPQLCLHQGEKKRMKGKDCKLVGQAACNFSRPEEEKQCLKLPEEVSTFRRTWNYL